jgi:hypothetical protein
MGLKPENVTKFQTLEQFLAAELQKNAGTSAAASAATGAG